MDLSTSYLGLNLTNPIVVSSSKLTGNIENIQACAKYGAGAIVLKSIYEEQIIQNSGLYDANKERYFWFDESTNYIKNHSSTVFLNKYLDFIRLAKKETKVPIIASINCVSPLEWPAFTSKIEEAGADAIELNIVIFPFDATVPSINIEDTYIDIVNTVRQHTSLPISVKIGPYFTNMLAMSQRFVDAGVSGLVLFNRFYMPDIDIGNQRVITDNYYSAPDEKSIAMRWISLLSANEFNVDLAAATGIHYSIGVAKQLLAGADVTQISTTLYQNGISYLKEIVSGLRDWMKKNGFKTVDDFRGMLNATVENTAAYERLQYMKKNYD